MTVVGQDMLAIVEGLTAAQQLGAAGVGDHRKPTIHAVAEALRKVQRVVASLDGLAGDQLLFLLHVEGDFSVEQLASLTSWDANRVTTRLQREIVRRLDSFAAEYPALLPQQAQRVFLRLLPHIDAQLDENELDRVLPLLADATARMREQPERAGFEVARHSLLDYLPGLLLDLERQLAALRD